jgi:hypothetical protein
MNRFKTFLYAAALLASLGSAARAQQAPPAIPDGPFKAVHLMTVTPAQEDALKAAVGDFNRAFAKQGCPACAYHLFKMYGGQDGKYNYLMTSDWPGRDVYTAIHGSAAFVELSKKNPVMSDIGETEIYGRYVEVK